MKTEIKVTALSHGDLVCLLSTALYGSAWFDAEYNKEIYNNLENKNGDCFEDKLADMLLAGHKITIIDYDAEGEKYSNKFVRFVGRCESAEYEVGLQDFLNVASTADGYQLINEVLDGDGDFYTADAFLQQVVFDEVIYG